jgi:anti-anti-sigma regulatory factor
MAASCGSVDVCETPAGVTIRVTGRGRMDESLPLRRFAEKCLTGGGVRFRVELALCTYLDSTFLGTLLHLQRLARGRGGELVLIAPSRECLELLTQLGIHEFFVIEPACASPAGTWQQIAADRSEPEAFNRTVVEAHEELANLGGAAGEQFGPVARCLARNGPNTDTRQSERRRT